VGKTSPQRKITLYHFCTGISFLGTWHDDIEIFNKDIENLILCDSALYACLTLLSSIKPSYDSKLVESTITGALNFCKSKNNSFIIYKDHFDVGILPKLINAVDINKEHLKDAGNRLTNKLHELEELS
jgi:hypothetical protein